MRGFSLLELLLVIAVLAVLAGVGSGIYVNFVKNVELEETASMIIGDLKKARGKAMAGEDGVRWGIHFVNNGDDYYELFSTPGTYSHASASVKETTYLSGGLSFAAPSAGGTSTVIFSKVRATTTATTTITIFSSYNSISVTTTPAGNIY